MGNRLIESLSNKRLFSGFSNMKSQADITMKERREIRNFQRYLRLLPRYELRMLQSPRWQRYLGLTTNEAWLYAKGKSKLGAQQ